MILDASFSSDLNWNIDLTTELVTIEFDFGWGKGPFLINDPALFQSYTLAIDKFSKEIWPHVREKCSTVILFRGSLSILSTIVVSDGELSPVEAANVFGNYLHRLASFLPEEVPVAALFDDTAHFSKGEAAQLLSQERFSHLQLSLSPSESTTGVLLPLDEHCTPAIIKELTCLFVEVPDLRVIPERMLNELWNGLDELVVFEEALSQYGKRQILGFEAAGGKVRSRGI